MENLRVKEFVENFMFQVKAKNPCEPEFHQAVQEVVETLAEFVLDNPIYLKHKILERLAEPERVIS